MEQAAADAKKDFGLGDAQFKVPQDWNLNTSNQLIQSLVAQGFNAFSSWPADANASNGTFAELVAQGVPVISTAACINQPTDAAFCLSTDVANSAYLGTKALIAALGGKGKIVHGTGYLKDLNSQLRMDAVKKAVAETNGAVELIQTLADIDDQEAADKAINQLLAARAAEIDGIVTTAYVPSVVGATALKNIGDKRIKMVGIDDDPVVLDAIREGFLVGTMSQNPYGQAYIGAKVLTDLVSGCVPKQDAPFHIDSGTLLITGDNVETYNDERVKLTKEIADSFRTKYLDCP
jgi:ribose transport system substrate-binding protein